MARNMNVGTSTDGNGMLITATITNSTTPCRETRNAPTHIQQRAKRERGPTARTDTTALFRMYLWMPVAKSC